MNRIRNAFDHTRVQLRRVETVSNRARRPLLFIYVSPDLIRGQALEINELQHFHFHCADPSANALETQSFCRTQKPTAVADAQFSFILSPSVWQPRCARSTMQIFNFIRSGIDDANATLWADPARLIEAQRKIVIQMEMETANDKECTR